MWGEETRSRSPCMPISVGRVRDFRQCPAGRVALVVSSGFKDLLYHVLHCWCTPPTLALFAYPNGPLNTHSSSIRRSSTRSKRGRRAGQSHVVPPLVCAGSYCPQTEQSLQEPKQQAKLIFRRITANSESRRSIESGQYTLQYVATWC